MAAYYNEFDHSLAEWLRELINEGVVAYGEVDERDIREVEPRDLEGFTQHHFFAGIGGWSYGLRLAGWSDEEPVWSGSCPCQSFSVAGKGLGTDDERHLWPAFRWLIGQCNPSVVFGEQVASKAGRNWLDGVLSDLEEMGYAAAGADLCAPGIGKEGTAIPDNARCMSCGEMWFECGCEIPGPFDREEKIVAGAPHIRQRLWFVADAGFGASGRLAKESSRERRGRWCQGSQRGSVEPLQAQGHGSSGGMENSCSQGTGCNSGASCGQGRQSVDAGSESVRQVQSETGADGTEPGGKCCDRQLADSESSQSGEQNSGNRRESSCRGKQESELADSECQRWEERCGSSAEDIQRVERTCGQNERMADTDDDKQNIGESEIWAPHQWSSERRSELRTCRYCRNNGMANCEQQGLEGHAGNVENGSESGRECTQEAGHAPEGGYVDWSYAIWWQCSDGKWRRVPARYVSARGAEVSCNKLGIQGDGYDRLETEPAIQPVVDGIPEGVDDLWITCDEEAFPLSPKVEKRKELLKGSGNAIVPPLAAEFIRTWMDIVEEKEK